MGGTCVAEQEGVGSSARPHVRSHPAGEALITGVIAVGLGAAVIAWAPGWLRPTVSRSRVRTALVDVGVVEATVSASGAVVPEIEQVASVAQLRRRHQAAGADEDAL